MDRLLRSGSDCAYIDAVTYPPLRTLHGHKAPVYRCRFVADGQRLLTASADNTVRIWSVPDGRELMTLRGHMGEVLAATASPDGKRIVSASEDKTVRIWDTATGKSLHILSGHNGRVVSAEWDPSGKRIVTTSADLTVRLWDAETGQPIAVLNEAPMGSYHASFSPDGQRLAIANAVGEAKIIWIGTSLRSAYRSCPDNPTAAAQPRRTGKVSLGRSSGNKISVNIRDLFDYCRSTACPSCSWKSDMQLGACTEGVERDQTLLQTLDLQELLTSLSVRQAALCAHWGSRRVHIVICAHKSFDSYANLARAKQVR